MLVRRLAAAALLVAMGMLAGACATGPRPHSVAPTTPDPDPLYAAVIDAGSSASRIHIFRWRPAGDAGLPWIEPVWEEEVRPGLSELAESPEQVAAALSPLLEFAIEQIGAPAKELGRYPLHLKATAGLRLLPPERQRAVIDAAAAYLASTPFAFGRAEVISGEQEGIYGWLSVNYLLGFLDDGGPYPSAGALDLGGASTQITFVPLDGGRPGETAVLEIGPSRYPLYSHSYLGLGQDQALEELASAACYPSGYPIPGGGTGAGDYAACHETLRQGLTGECPVGRCSLMGEAQPPVYGDFVAFSAYRFAASFFELGQDLDLERLESAGQAYCAQDWQTIRIERADELDNPYLPRNCFTAAYLVALLHDGFGFPMDGAPIRAPAELQGQEVSWTLGALLWELAGARIN